MSGQHAKGSVEPARNIFRFGLGHRDGWEELQCRGLGLADRVAEDTLPEHLGIERLGKIPVRNFDAKREA